ncbi:MAG TPA: hypothetical protein VG796_14685 [Verrucomicrobiales bacterium]|nr:hypothetical protein [Verrucomicrobiales bacterium]
MAKPAAPDEAELVKMGMTLLEQSGIAVTDRRDELLSDADAYSLGALLRCLYGMKGARVEFDAHYIHVKRMMDARIAADVKARDAAMKAELASPERAEEVRAVVAGLEEIVGTKCPALPCELEPMIRWAGSVPEAFPSGALEEAFKDYLATCAAANALQDDLFERNRRFAENEAQFAGAIAANPKNAAESRKEYKTRAKSAAKEAASLKEIADFPEVFRPGCPVPPSLAYHAAASFLNSWNQPFTDPANYAGRLRYLVEGFRPFWRQHGMAYMAILVERERLKRAQSGINRDKGTAGGREKARKKYVAYTQTFVQWLGARTVTSELIDLYPKQEGVTETKGRQFLGTLLTAKGKPKSMKAMQETLSGVGIKLEQSAAEECYSILFDKKIPGM